MWKSWMDSLDLSDDDEFLLGAKNKCWDLFFSQSKWMKIGEKGRWWWKWETMLTSIILFKVNWCTLGLLYFEVYFVYSRIWGERIMSTSIFFNKLLYPDPSSMLLLHLPPKLYCFLDIYLYIYIYILYICHVVCLVVARISLHTKSKHLKQNGGFGTFV